MKESIFQGNILKSLEMGQGNMNNLDFSEERVIIGQYIVLNYGKQSLVTN